MKTTSKLLALALLTSLAPAVLAEQHAASKQHATMPHDHTPQVHDRSAHASH